MLLLPLNILLFVEQFYPAGIYLVNVSNENTSRTMCKIYAKLILEALDRLQWYHSAIFIDKIEQISRNYSGVSIVDMLTSGYFNPFL